MSLQKIESGCIIDPATKRDGVVGDLWIRDGRIVDDVTSDEAASATVLDANGYVVMAGGIDMHSHIAGPKVNSGRSMSPELKRDQPAWKKTEITRAGTMGPVPSTFTTGYAYNVMGYTTAFDAAIPGLHARCLLYTSPSPRDQRGSRMPSSA